MFPTQQLCCILTLTLFRANINSTHHTQSWSRTIGGQMRLTVCFPPHTALSHLPPVILGLGATGTSAFCTCCYPLKLVAYLGFPKCLRQKTHNKTILMNLRHKKLESPESVLWPKSTRSADGRPAGLLTAHRKKSSHPKLCGLPCHPRQSSLDPLSVPDRNISNSNQFSKLSKIQ